MTETSFSFSHEARIAIWQENKRVERCMERRGEALRRLHAGLVEMTPEMKEAIEKIRKRMSTHWGAGSLSND